MWQYALGSLAYGRNALELVFARATRPPDDLAYNLDLFAVMKQEELAERQARPADADVGLGYVSLTRETFAASMTAPSVEEKSRLTERYEACEEHVGALVIQRQTSLLAFAIRLAERLLADPSPLPDSKTESSSYDSWISGPRERRFYGRDAKGSANLLAAVRTARAAAEDHLDSLKLDARRLSECAARVLSSSPAADRLSLAPTAMCELILVGALVVVDLARVLMRV